MDFMVLIIIEKKTLREINQIECGHRVINRKNE